jgi:hypothetical protein
MKRGAQKKTEGRERLLARARARQFAHFDEWAGAVRRLLIARDLTTDASEEEMKELWRQKTPPPEAVERIGRST